MLDPVLNLLFSLVTKVNKKVFVASLKCFMGKLQYKVCSVAVTSLKAAILS